MNRFEDLQAFVAVVETGSFTAAAERLDIIEIATLDRRHFSIVRPAHTHNFELLP